MRDKLQAEIDEETALTKKQEEILADLAQLEDRVRQRDARDIDIAGELDHVQMQMDLLKVFLKVVFGYFFKFRLLVISLEHM